VHIYIQATEDMGLLLGTSYNTALETLVDTAEPLWLTDGVAQHLYRFDVVWLEPERYFDAHGGGRGFAYPLDPSWWMRSGVRSQVAQVLEPGFYSLEWYVAQPRRAEAEYDRRIAGNPSFSDEDRRLISRTLEEISTLRNGDREISVLVTNFVGHAMENTAVRSQILGYLSGNTRQAISIFAFPNDNNPFYFLVLGSTREVIDFSEHLENRLKGMFLDFAFSFYATELATPILRSNADVSRDSIVTSFGVRQAFNEDIIETEEMLFHRYLFDANSGEDHRLLFTVWQRLIDDAIAPVGLTVHSIDVPRMLWNSVRFDYDVSLMTVVDSGQLSPPTGRRRTSIGNNPLTISDGAIDLVVELDTLALGNGAERALLIVSLYAYLHTEVNPEFGNIQDEWFISTFNQLARNVQGTQNRVQIAELYIHYIYR